MVGFGDFGERAVAVKTIEREISPSQPTSEIVPPDKLLSKA